MTHIASIEIKCELRRKTNLQLCVRTETLETVGTQVAPKKKEGGIRNEQGLQQDQKSNAPDIAQKAH